MFVGASPDFIRLNMLGRLVAPIFLFMVAEGMHFTRNRKSYLLLLLAGSIVMTLGDYFLQVRFPVEDVMLMNNIFATFLVTGLYIVFYDLLVEGIKVKSATKILAAIGRMLLPIAISFLTLQMIPFPYPALYLISMVLPNLIFIE
ncbi:MAG: hypothetical protein LBU27_04140 [Candidatus Peribacteria bacterium]|jgi:D-alanyl-lipoteichoic acid acyltransferase DltB (MBOAT superfamily)|nr:hypothetical protein [Candidatus Peribacteria bacterium]